MLNIRIFKVDLVFLRSLINLFIFICLITLLVSCSKNSDDVIKKKTESEGFVLQLEMHKQFEKDEKLTLEVGMYQKLFDENITINYNSHLIDIKILDKKNNEFYSLGYEDRIYEGEVGNEEGVLNTISLSDLNLPQKEYTIVVSCTFLYNGKEINLKLSETFNVN